MSSMTSRLDQRRAATNQSLFRDVNKRVNDINKAHDLWVTLSDWACVCLTASRSPPRAASAVADEASAELESLTSASAR
jgi:hypothetical protein